MSGQLFFAVALLALSGHATAQTTLPEPGIWTNEEDTYFAEEEGRIKAGTVYYQFAADGRWRLLDSFGEPVGEWQDAAPDGLAATGDGTWSVNDSELRRARPFTCWISVRKFAGKPDGSSDWTFARDLDIFDQGGRIAMPGKGEAPDMTLRMRNVTWARNSRNTPSLVIYLHRDDPERAETYSWASPDATLVGINARWAQASCSPKETN